MRVLFLDAADVIDIHALQLQKFGGLDGIRDRALLHSAINEPKATFAGQYLYRTLFDKAAAYGFGLIKNHPFVDGNKRTGMASAITFLLYNGIKIELKNGELYHWGMAVATSQITREQLARELKKISKK